MSQKVHVFSIPLHLIRRGDGGFIVRSRHKVFGRFEVVEPPHSDFSLTRATVVKLLNRRFPLAVHSIDIKRCTAQNCLRRNLTGQVSVFSKLRGRFLTVEHLLKEEMPSNYTGWQEGQ